jgi:hypothetical protein
MLLASQIGRVTVGIFLVIFNGLNLVVKMVQSAIHPPIIHSNQNFAFVSVPSGNQLTRKSKEPTVNADDVSCSLADELIVLRVKSARLFSLNQPT